MKKAFILFFLAIGIVCLISSCNPKTGEIIAQPTDQTSKSDSTKTIVLMTQESLRQVLEQGYYNDAYVKNIHPVNSSTVTYTATKTVTTKETQLTDNGGVKTHDFKLKTSILGTLAANTAGEIDSIVRYDTRNIFKFRIRYVIAETGKSHYIWYYRSEKSPYWYSSYNTVDLEIEGIAAERTTMNNRLKWDLSETGDSKLIKKTFSVISPFSGGTNDKGKKENQEEVEKNKQ